MDFEYLTSEKGKNRVLYKGFLYFFDKNGVEEKTFWRCSSYQKTKCKARLHLKNDLIIWSSEEHNHAADAAKIDAQKHLANIKRRAENSFAGNTQQIISIECVNISAAAASRMPANRSICRTVRRQRQEASKGVDLMPLNRNFLIPDCYKSLSNGTSFLLFDSGADDLDRMLIFTTNDNMEILKNSVKWFCDGTFSVCPINFFQLYVIHGIYEGKSTPLVFALLPTKSQNMYTRLITQLSVIHPSLSPKKIYMDFELAAMNAFELFFPEAVVRGCYFHFRQAFYKSISRLGLKSKYDTDATFAMHCKLLPALAFVPPENVVEYFNVIVRADLIPDDLINYFEDNYVGRCTLDNKRKAPRFSIEKWNVYHSTLENDERTNNYSEGWNRGFSVAVGIDHPNIFRFIEALKIEQAKNEVQRIQMLAGDGGPPRKRTYLAYNIKLKSIVKTFAEKTPLKYLEAISYNIDIN